MNENYWDAVAMLIFQEDFSADQVIDSQRVHIEDRAALEMLVDAIAQAKNISNVQLRIIGEDENYHWCEISITFVNKQNGKPYKAVGFIEIIDERVEKEELLRQKSEIDQLTKIYNKTTTEHLI